MRFSTLKRPAEFRRVRGGVRIATKLFIIEGRARASGAAGDDANLGHARFGFTITRKIGNAVARNRIRRRLKEALRTLETPLARSDHDYVVVASRAAHDYPFAELQHALRIAFEQLHEQAVSGAARRGPRKRTSAGNGGSPARLAGDVPRPDVPQPHERGDRGRQHDAPVSPGEEPQAAAAPDPGTRGEPPIERGP